MSTGPQDKVDLMGKVFLGRLPVRFEKMNEALAQCRADLAGDAGWTELHRLLHSLGGAAGTFGFDALGQQARALELRVAQVLAQPLRSELDVVMISEALTALQRTT